MKKIILCLTVVSIGLLSFNASAETHSNKNSTEYKMIENNARTSLENCLKDNNNSVKDCMKQTKKMMKKEKKKMKKEMKMENKIKEMMNN